METYRRLSEVYDEGWSEFTGWALDFLRRQLITRHMGKVRLLDLACGTGTFCDKLAREGHDVLGIDKSPWMIERAVQKSRGIKNCTFQVGDMSRFMSDDRFQIVTCWFDSINYLLKKSDILRMFRQVSDSLEVGGLFIFDSNTDNHYIAHHNGTHDRELGGITIHHECRYDKNRRRARTTFTFEDGDSEEHIQRPYNLSDLKPSLHKVGLTIRDTFGNFKGDTYSAESKRLICVTQK